MDTQFRISPEHMIEFYAAYGQNVDQMGEDMASYMMYRGSAPLSATFQTFRDKLKAAGYSRKYLSSIINRSLIFSFVAAALDRGDDDSEIGSISPTNDFSLRADSYELLKNASSEENAEDDEDEDMFVADDVLRVIAELDISNSLTVTQKADRMLHAVREVI